MSTAYYDYSIDPVNNQIYPLILRSASKGGTTDYKIGVPDLTISAAANFPSTNTTTAPSRYFLELPMDSYYTSTNTTAFSVYNETQARALTVITPSASLSNYTCKFMNTGSERKSVLEVHVGSTSNQANDVISYEGYFSGSALKSTVFDNIYSTQITGSTVSLNGLLVLKSTASTITNDTTSLLAGITIDSTVASGTVISILAASTDNASASGNARRALAIGTPGFITNYSNVPGITITSNYRTYLSTPAISFQANIWSSGSSSYGTDSTSNALIGFGAGNECIVLNSGAIRSTDSILASSYVSSTRAGIVTRSTFSAAFNPTNANIGTALGLSSVKPAGWVGVIGTTASTCYVVTTDGSSWYFIATMTRAT